MGIKYKDLDAHVWHGLILIIQIKEQISDNDQIITFCILHHNTFSGHMTPLYEMPYQSKTRQVAPLTEDPAPANFPTMHSRAVAQDTNLCLSGTAWLPGPAKQK